MSRNMTDAEVVDGVAKRLAKFREGGEGVNGYFFMAVAIDESRHTTGIMADGDGIEPKLVLTGIFSNMIKTRPRGVFLAELAAALGTALGSPSDGDCEIMRDALRELRGSPDSEDVPPMRPR